MTDNLQENISYYDRVYGKIVIDEPVILELIGCSALQRLKEIDQSGHFEPFYPGTFQSRFEHSAGVYFLLKKYGAPLAEQIAGLIHDVSHSAFSHCIDYVMEDADPARQNHQDNIFERFIKKTSIPRIVKKYGFDIDYILNDKNFPLKESNLPDLCADRIDYSLRTARVFHEIDSAKYFLDKLHAKNGKWFFADKKSAKEFAILFSKLNSNYYAGFLSAVMFASVGGYLRYSLDRGYINKSDLYTTDRQVLQKIARHHKSDRHLRELLNRMDNKSAFKNSAADHDDLIVCKSRAVDPLFKYDRKLVKLSKADKSWTKVLKKETKPKTYFIKFGRRWQTPQKAIAGKISLTFVSLAFITTVAITFYLLLSGR